MVRWIDDVQSTIMINTFRLSLFLSCILLLFTGCQSYQLDPTDETDTAWVFDWDELEARIIELTNQAVRDESPSELYRFKSQLVKIHTGEDDERALSREYWTAVLNTNLIFLEQEIGADDQVHRLIDESIELLEQTDYAIAETNSLLALLYRAKIDYDKTRTFELFSKMQDALDRAIEADPTNLRVLFAQIFIGVSPVTGFSIDIDVQANINTVLSSNYETKGDAMTPTWGLPEIYGIAIGRLMEAEKITEASELTAMAIAKFPSDATLGYFALLFQIEQNDVEP
ncbi:MAG: hypothetical protein F4X56_06790 [Gammaproteobacteria bacterium]|nr:hypothetical protein [Gammaproteobacteria bacterium]MYC25606.1 hypothetical protein [Gammaproteobacteria bacterium]